MAITKIAEVTVGAGGQTAIDFTSIPSSPYADLMIIYSIRTNLAGVNYEDMALKINASTANGTVRVLRGYGSSASGFTQTWIGYGMAAGAASTAGTFGSGQIYLPNYAGATNKSISWDSVQDNNGTETFIVAATGLWSQTTAINAVSLYSLNGSIIQQYSTATLYGITKGSSGGVTVA
jgi:hypothetical protein